MLHAFAYGDGGSPNAGLVMDKNGDLYGTTSVGGANGAGTVFEITAAGEEKLLHSFTDSDGDGGIPYAGLVMDKKGNLYGTTAQGGANGVGTVFKITAAGEEKVLYSFIGSNGDGGFPFAGLVMDKKGNLYGTTGGGGANGVGTVFKVSPSGTETVLYSFCSQPGCTDGANPYAGLVMDKRENLYGTTPYGGANGVGTVFKVTP